MAQGFAAGSAHGGADFKQAAAAVGQRPLVERGGGGETEQAVLRQIGGVLRRAVLRQISGRGQDADGGVAEQARVHGGILQAADA